jgi:glycosyltransferase involved in cell wall biosynthesis
MLEREHIRVSSGSKSRRIREGVPLQSRKSPPLLLCLSHLRWDFVWQRPQHLLSRAASDFRVIVFEEPVFKPEALPHLDISERASGVTVAFPVLKSGMSSAEIEAQQRRLLDGLLAAERPQELVLWYYTPMAIAFSGHVEADFCVYDNMDELSAFRGASPEMIANEAELLARADIVFTGGLSLYEAKRDRHPRVRAFPSSIEAAHFAAARRATGAEPADQARIPHSRVGFFGVIDERMDLDLVDAVAKARPDWQFVMIGPVVKIDEAALPRRDNIHWLGSKAYAELPSYLGGWDVGFMPFALNESTRFISPTKTPEFLAAGLPVVSTAITDVIRPYGEKGLVEIASSPEDAVGKIELLLARPRSAWLARVDRQLGTGSWDKTWSEMRRTILDGLGRPAGRDHSRLPVAIAAE